MYEIYDLMCCNTKIGSFFVDDTLPKRKFKIELIEKYINSKHLLGLKALQTNFLISDENVRFYISRRVAPPNRDGIDEILYSLNLSEYDPYLIAKHNRFATLKDRIWVNFNNERMEDFHPKASILIPTTEKLISQDSKI